MIESNKILHNLIETEEVAIILVTELNGGEWVALEGDLGAGKTTFVQFVAKAFGIIEPVRSPTYSLVHVYETKHPKIKFLVHADLYRLETVNAEDIGLDEWLNRKDAVVFIEWPDRLVDGKFSKKIVIFQGDNDFRILSIE